MKLVDLAPDQLVVMSDLARSRTSKVFQDRLRASIQEMGLAEPLKVAEMPTGKYLVVDGMIRLRAIQAIRQRDAAAFPTVPAYVVDFGRRFEIRYQTDIYQDLLPSQLASLVEHLHAAENVAKVEIARFIGVSPATLRNYTGLWRLVQRGGLFERIVELMDVGVIPASTPYAWLRLTEFGLHAALTAHFAGGVPVGDWIDQRIARARRGDIAPYALQYVETSTSSLPAACYLAGEDVRARKRELGLRRRQSTTPAEPWDPSAAIQHATRVSDKSCNPVLKLAARSLAAYLK